MDGTHNGVINMMSCGCIQGFPGGAVVKNPPANAGDAGDSGDSGDAGDSAWVLQIRWNRKWEPTPVFLPG